LIVEHLDCNKWIFKIDNEWGGRGVAHFDPGHMKAVARLRNEKTSHPVRWRSSEVIRSITV
jgi:hypothetical protein